MLTPCKSFAFKGEFWVATYIIKVFCVGRLSPQGWNSESSIVSSLIYPVLFCPHSYSSFLSHNSENHYMPNWHLFVTIILIIIIIFSWHLFAHTYKSPCIHTGIFLFPSQAQDSSNAQDPHWTQPGSKFRAWQGALCVSLMGIVMSFDIIAGWCNILTKPN